MTLPTLVVNMLAVSPPGQRFLTGPVVAPNKHSTRSQEVILGINEVFAPSNVRGQDYGDGQSWSVIHWQ